MELEQVKNWLKRACNVNQEIADLETSAANIQARAASVASLCRDGQAARAAARYAATVTDYTRRLSAQAAAVAKVIALVQDE